MVDQVFSIIPRKVYAHLGFKRRFISYQPKRGQGYFSSSFPNFIVSVEGVPSIGEVRVLQHSTSIIESDGVLVAKTMSDITGQWRIYGLDPETTYDVVCRVDGYNDMIFANVKPKI